MSENKFIQHLKGKGTAKSIVEIKNQKTPTSFADMPQGTSDASVVYSDHRGNTTVVANGTVNWKLNGSALDLATTVNGNGTDYSSVYNAQGAGLWVNAVYTFPNTGDPVHPVAMVFNPQTKWVLKLCGNNLLSQSSDTVELTLVITIGTTNIISKSFVVKEQANQFCKELVIDFAESNTQLIKAQGESTMRVQVLCGTADASAQIYNGMSVLTLLQRKVEAVAVSNDFANIDEVLQNGMLPSDYFNNVTYIDQVEDGEEAYAVFQRDGDTINLSGWTSKDAVAYKDEVIIKSETMPTASADLLGAIYQYVGETTAPYQHGYIYECVEISAGVYGWERIDVQPGGSRGRFLSLWDCATGLPESTPPISPFEYKSGDYYIVSAVSTATPPVNYKPDGSSYTTGVPSTTVETDEVAVDDTYFYDGTTWKLQSNSNKTVTFSNIAGDIYDNASATTALNAKQDTLTAGTNINITGTTISATDTTYTGSDGITLTGTNFTNSGVRGVTSGTSNGTISVNTNGTSADVAVTGLGSAAYTASSDYATSAQGSLADTAVQPADLANYVTTNTTQTITGEKVFSGIMNYSAGKTYILAGNGGTKLGYWSYDIDGQSNITLQTMTASTRNINFKTNNGGKVTYNGSEIAKVSDLPSVMTGATAGDAGTNGLVPAPAAGDQGKFLQGDGTWASVDALPSQSGQSGKFLTTDGTDASWATISAVPDIDNSTITKNSSDELQAVATVNANTAAGATNPVYDWVGTLAEYNAQDIENQHPDWMCYITDDVSGGTSVYTKTEVDNIASGKANVALDNLTSAGKAVCANMSMPSGTYTDLTIGAHGTSYSAPADGYFIVKGYNSSATLSNLFGCLNTSTGLGCLIPPSSYSGSESCVTVPAKKNEQVVIYNYGGTFTMVRFVYANGAA